jgi:glutathione peroxidase
MIKPLLLVAVLAGFSFASAGDDQKKGTDAVPPVLQYKMKSLAGDEVDLARYQGRVLLIVNTASKCGYTPQYKDLEAVYRKYHDKGFDVLGFPANNFKGQEPGTDEQIAEFCEKSFGVTFPMFSKVSVLGGDQAPLFQYLTAHAPETGDIKWNFEKFLIARDGKVVGRFRSKANPSGDEVTKAIEAELSK